jgi:hypothetical protein
MMAAMEPNDRQASARALGAAMSRLAGEGIFAGSPCQDEARELSAFTQALALPAGDGRHLAEVVSAFSSALAAACERRSTSS